jgi:membrane carboxypeptidase/penicillin-binding protein PbpC
LSIELSDLIAANEASDLYFVDPNTTRIIYLPRNWVNEFFDHDENGHQETYCWYGNEDTLAYQDRESKEMLTTDSQGWFRLADLDAMRRVTYNEAKVIDSELFKLLEDYDAKRCS